MYLHSTTGLAGIAALKLIDVQLELETDTDMLLMIKPGIRGGICQSVNKKYKKNYIKTNSLHKLTNLIKIICTDLKWVRIYQLMDLNGKKLNIFILMPPKITIKKVVKLATFYHLNWNILNNCDGHTTSYHFFLKKLF